MNPQIAIDLWQAWQLHQEMEGEKWKGRNVELNLEQQDGTRKFQEVQNSKQKGKIQMTARESR